jgi:uncharacterized protein YutE (UPF0331/DUF86 family)
VDVGAIVSRLSVIRQCVNALRAMQHLEYDAFAQDRLTLTSAEHELQIAIQAVLDIGLILLSEQPVRAPAEYREIFPRLAEAGILPREFGDRLAAMARFRNVLLHLYVDVDAVKVFEIIQQDLDDFDTFAKHVSDYLNIGVEDE